MILQRFEKRIWQVHTSLLRLTAMRIGAKTLIAPKARFIGKAGLQIGEHARIGQFTRFECIQGGTIQIGKNCRIYRYAELLTYGGHIHIGNYCSVHPWTLIAGPGNIRIGNNVRIANKVNIIASNHRFSDKNIPIHRQGLNGVGIVIEDDCWLAANVTVLDGVTIAEGCVIGAGAVVTKNTTAFGIYAGVPAKRLAERK